MLDDTLPSKRLAANFHSLAVHSVLLTRFVLSKSLLEAFIGSSALKKLDNNDLQILQLQQLHCRFGDGLSHHACNEIAPNARSAFYRPWSHCSWSVF